MNTSLPLLLLLLLLVQGEPLPSPLPPQLKELELVLHRGYHLNNQALAGLTRLERLKLFQINQDLLTSTDESALLYLPPSLTYLNMYVIQVKKQAAIPNNHSLFQLARYVFKFLL